MTKFMLINSLKYCKEFYGFKDEWGMPSKNLT